MGEGGLDRFGEKAVDAGDEQILHTSILQLGQHLQPKFGAS